MKSFLLSLLIILLSAIIYSQTIPGLPFALGAANAVVWDNSIYLFGGSNNWNGSIVYPVIHKYDGTGWVNHGSIPDNNVWDAATVLVGDNVYLFGGWENGQSKVRRYNLVTGEWTNLQDSPNTIQKYGLTAQAANDKIYLFNSDGEVMEYNISANTWSNKSFNTATDDEWGLRSVLYQGEIYIVGWNNRHFYKYNPSTDQWTRLANVPYEVSGSGPGIIDNKIYCIGGGGTGSTVHKSIVVFDITGNSWTTSSKELSSNRYWMAATQYAGGLYVFGGFNQNSNAVADVEEIEPQGTASVKDNLTSPENFMLYQNYPNPFNPSTRITWQSPVSSHQTLKVYDLLGNEVVTLVNEYKPAGIYEVDFDATGLSSGIYIYRLHSEHYSASKKLTLIK